jgi:hypothetical protein
MIENIQVKEKNENEVAQLKKEKMELQAEV